MASKSEFEIKRAEARNLYLSGRHAEAEALYAELLQFVAAREALLRELIQLNLSSQNLKGAAIYCAQLSQYFPDNLDYTLNAANLWGRAGDPGNAIGFYEKLLAKKPDLPNSQYNLARLLKSVGRRREAIKVYERALRFGINDPEEVHNNLAVIYSELHEEKKSLFHLQKSLEIKSDYIPALFNIAGLYEEAGDKAQAESYFRSIIARDPHYYPALCRLAHMRLVESDRVGLIAKIKRALNDNAVTREEKEDLYFALGKLLDESSQFDEAFQNYRQGNLLAESRFRPYDKVHSERYIADIVRQFDRSWFSGVVDHTGRAPIFICGMFRSGSTLVEQILSGHSGVTAGGELGYFPDLVDKLSPEYPVSLGKMNADLFQRVGEAYLDYLNTTFGPGKLVTDKRPDNFLHIGLIKSAFPRAKIIWTKRALLDNCLSIYFQQLGGNASYSVSLDNIGHYYSLHCRLMRNWQQIFPGSIYELCYEDLIDRPEGEVRELLGFLGLSWEAGCLNFSDRKNYVKTASVWQVRESLNRDAIGRYKNYSEFLAALEKYNG